MNHLAPKTFPLPRIAASSYLNTAPLIWSFEQGTMREKVKLITDCAPAKSAEALARRAVDAALVPVIEYQRMSDVAIVPGVCVGSKHRVRSVVLVTKGKELAQVESIALDVSSRTSAGLVEIIFREFLSRQVRYAPAAPDIDQMLFKHDAALVIGDPAMTIARNGVDKNGNSQERRIYDLAALWRELTGCGFVFAVWMVPNAKESQARVCNVDWAAARDEGLRHSRKIIDDCKVPLPPTELRTYLHENICYNLDDELLAGLKLYYQLARKHELVPQLRDINFFG